MSSLSCGPKSQSLLLLVRAFDDEIQAREIADRLIRAKVKRQYRIVAGYRPPGIDAEAKND